MPDFTLERDKDGLLFHARSRLGAAFLDCEFAKITGNLSEGAMRAIIARAQAAGLTITTR